jgi:glycosyltransferase involved in cell wall biosynthesis
MCALQSDISYCTHPGIRNVINTTMDVTRHNSPSEPLTVSVVVPLLNEQPTLEALYRRLSETLLPITDTYEIIFVDDGSSDGSIKVLKALHAVDPAVQYIRFRRNFGKSAALAAGFQRARYEIIVTLDADLQDQPEEIPQLIAKLTEGYDLVSGWRFQRNDKLSRRLGSAIYNRSTALLTGVRLHDINCGLKCYRREVLDEVMVYGERHRFIPVLASYRGFRLGEVRVEHSPREFGKSRFGVGRIFGGIFSLLTVILMTRYTNRPLHFFGIMGMILGLTGVVINSYLILARLIFKQWLSNRPLLIIGTLLIIVSVQFILFGLLAEMIAFSYRRESDYSVVETSGARAEGEALALEHPEPRAEARKQKNSR